MVDHKGFINPTSAIQVGISPVMWVSLWEALIVYHRSGHFPQPCKGTPKLGGSHQSGSLAF